MLRFLLSLALLCGLAGQVGAAPPTPRQLEEKYKAGDYRGVLEGLAQALALRGGAAEGYDRYALLMLKGDALAHLDQGEYAAHAFHDAAAATDDPAKIAPAKANELIVRKGLALRYVPRTGADRAPLDLKQPDSRKKAMLALRADLLAQNRQRIEQARTGDTLEPALALLPALREIAVLEVGATGELAQTKPLLVELGTRARGLITAELKATRGRVEELSDTANEITSTGGFGGGYVDRRGLFSKERRDLAATAHYVEQIETVAREGRRIANLLGGAVAEWERIVADSNELETRIDGVLRRG